MYLNILIALIGIVNFSMAMLPNMYCQTPMTIVGKFYASSLLVLINSWMVLGSEETQTPSKVISVLIFSTAPANLADSAIEADNRDLAADTRA